jgi:non-haem Fe2+, alpha-ketoglutarate-dependent halogenase
MTASLTAEQLARYRAEGYLAPVGAMSADEVVGLRQAIEGFGRRHSVNEALILRNNAHLKMPSLVPVVSDPRVLDAVESIVGPDILCWGSSFFIKEPGGREFVAWHQDSYYWDMTPDDVCVAWIALVDSTEENGAMRVVPGSHRIPAKPHKASPDGSGNMLFTYEEIAIEVDEAQTVACTLAAGQMSIHHMGTIHGSGRNNSTDRRIGYSITYLAPHVRHGGKRDSALLVRGQDRYGHFRPDPVSEVEMDPAVLAFIDVPYGGSLPVAARARRPQQDFYRKRA